MRFYVGQKERTKQERKQKEGRKTRKIVTEWVNILLNNPSFGNRGSILFSRTKEFISNIRITCIK
jgi:hypothetical protein